MASSPVFPGSQMKHRTYRQTGIHTIPINPCSHRVFTNFTYITYVKCTYSILCLSFFLLLASCKDDETDRIAFDPTTCSPEELEQEPINRFQVIASHNSYRKRTWQPLWNLINLGTAILPDGLIPEYIDPSIQWDYHHEPLPTQFNQYGVRGVELDLYNDPQGGLYANQLGRAIAGQSIASGDPDLDEPGIKIMHIAHFDWETHYTTFRQSLEAMRDWSQRNPGHFPVYVHMELKDQSFPVDIPALVQPFNDDNVGVIAEEIREVMPSEMLMTPEEMRTRSTLLESIQTDGWPTLAETRGKFFFIVMGEKEIDGTIFGSASRDPNSVFLISNNPVDGQATIRNLVEEGYIVRTRADAGTTEARTGDTQAREFAMSSGAQIISTDYYRPDWRFVILPDQWTNYSVQWPNGQTARHQLQTNCYAK